MYRIGYVFETTPGITPASPLQIMRTTGGGAALTPQTIESEELHVGETTDVIRVGAAAAGRFNGEPSYGGQLDDMLAAIHGNTWVADQLMVGSLKRTLTFEEHDTGPNLYQPWRYSLVNALSLSFAMRAKPSISVGYVSAKPPTAVATVSAGTGAAVAASTNRIFDPVQNIRIMQEGGAGSMLNGTPGLTAFTMDFARPVIEEPQMGSLELSSADPGIFSVGGTLSCYYRTAALLDKFLGDVMTSLSFTVGGATLNYNFLFSKVILASGGVAERGRNTPLVQTYNWRALYDPTNTSSLITRGT